MMIFALPRVGHAGIAALARNALCIVVCVVSVARVASPSRGSEPPTTFSPNAQKQYDTLFLAEEKKVGSGGKAAARFAAKLVDSLASVADDKELSFLVCEKAMTFGMRDADGFKSASEAMKKLIRLHPDETEVLKARQFEMYRQIYAKGRSGPEHAEAGAALLDVAVSQANELYNGHRYVEALKAYHEAAAIAASVKSPHADELNLKVKDVQSKMQVVDKVNALSEARVPAA